MRDTGGLERALGCLTEASAQLAEHAGEADAGAALRAVRAAECALERRVEALARLQEAEPPDSSAVLAQRYEVGSARRALDAAIAALLDAAGGERAGDRELDALRAEVDDLAARLTALLQQERAQSRSS